MALVGHPYGNSWLQKEERKNNSLSLSGSCENITVISSLPQPPSKHSFSWPESLPAVQLLARFQVKDTPLNVTGSRNTTSRESSYGGGI